MKKKPSKSTAKRSAAKPARKRVPVDAGGHTLLFDPRTGEPTIPAPRLSAAQRARIKARERERVQAARERQAARRAAFNARLARRPAAMQAAGFRLPDDVAAFLKRLRDDPLQWNDQREQITVADAREMIEEAYMEGCTEGFIEGRVLDLEPKRERSRKANAAKRQKPREHNGMRFTLDQRDAAIVAEHALLRPMVGATEAQLRLAEKYELTDKMIRIIIGKARKAAR